MLNDLNTGSASDYHQWLRGLKTRFVQVQLKAAVAVNTELLQLYWELGAEILPQRANQRWGNGFLENLSRDLMLEFPDMKGFSKRNLEQIRRWHQFWSQHPAIAKQAASQLFAILWCYHVVTLSKCQTHTLPAPQSELARQMLKDPYVALQVGEREFFLDLLLYHARPHCYVVVELKTVDFESEFAGNLNFYLKAVDEHLRDEHDAPTIGLLLCKSKDKLVAEYALSDMSKPLGLATYELSHTLPYEMQGQLPSIEALEAELKGVGNGK